MDSFDNIAPYCCPLLYQSTLTTMRVAALALAALPFSTLAMAHVRPMERANRLSRVEGRWQEKGRRAGVLGGLLGGDGDGDDDTSSSAQSSTTSSTSATAKGTTSTPAAGDTTSDVSSKASSVVTPSASASHSSVTASVTASAGLNSTSLVSSASANASSTSSSMTSSTAPSSTSEADHSTTLVTDAAGKTVVQTLWQTLSASSAAASSSDKSDSSGGDSISTPSIVGISVAVGVVVLALVVCAVWRMKRRNSDEDEVIRWPELNRHGDSDAHHALPARETGKHGIETSPLERSLSNSSSIFASSAAAPHTPMSEFSHAPAMALNGSNFGAASSLEDYQHHTEQGYLSPTHDNGALTGRPMSGYDNDDAYDYASFPPPVQPHVQPVGIGGTGAYDSDDEHGRSSPVSPPPQAPLMSMPMANVPGHGPVSYGH